MEMLGSPRILEPGMVLQANFDDISLEDDCSLTGIQEMVKAKFEDLKSEPVLCRGEVSLTSFVFNSDNSLESYLHEHSLVSMIFSWLWDK